MHATVEPLEDNRVKVSVTVPATEFDKALDAAFRKIAHEVRLPGFRPGKAPRKILEARLGTEAARQQALQDALPQYYADAVIEHDVDAIAYPEITITAGEEDGDVAFDAVVEVRPVIEVMGYNGLRVTVPYTPVDDATVDTQVNRIREQHARLDEITRPLALGDYATIDITGTQDGEELDGLVATDFLYPLGSDMIVAELDEQLRGVKTGDTIEFDAVLPERFGERFGENVHFSVTVKQAQEKVLPDLNDEWVDEQTEFETVAELREQTRTRADLMARAQAQMALRDRVLETLAGLVTIEAPETLVDQETRSRLNDFAHRLSHQGVGLEQYFQVTGQDPDGFVAEMRTGAQTAIKADLALRAVVVAEGIEATDEEFEEQLARLAERSGQKVEKVRREVDKEGAASAIRSDIVRGKALEFLVEHATVVDEEGNLVDIALDTPEATATVDAPSADE